MRQEIFDSTTRIKQLSQKPSDFLTELLVQQQQFACIEWLFHFQIFRQIPLNGSISYGELATRTQLPESDIRATARMAITANLLSETKQGKLAHNSLSADLFEDPGLWTWFSYLIKRSVPCMRAYTQASEKQLEVVESARTAYTIAMKTELSFFDHLKTNPELSAEFGKYMKSQSTVHAGATVDHLVEGFDWASLGEAKIVDVGGNSGTASMALAKHFEKLSFVVQDMPEPVHNGRLQAQSLSRKISERIQFVEHDFFTPQPDETKGADVYLFRMILHDWPDEDAVKILRHVAAAGKEGSRVVVMDMVLPIPGTASPTLEAALRQKDLMMRQVLNSREREVEDWHALFGKVDERLQIVAIRRPEGSQHSIIEISL
ncbi:methyltransferase [Lentithecium fluviatile CBS 122367]|uniref:Methyltransferase n=1 Tax=Lentithecium fluviatile CBS 122367 TaxID=1168545 RepID=A0A6G1JCV1_9PLEO|nr:methyltransferase [Lentithecium fluviatile CBS 122367]